MGSAHPAHLPVDAPHPTRVWALPDGRIAVPVAHVGETWLIVDQAARTVVGHGELSDEAVEITHRPGQLAELPGPMVAVRLTPYPDTPGIGWVAQIRDEVAARVPVRTILGGENCEDCEAMANTGRLAVLAALEGVLGEVLAGGYPIHAAAR